MDEKQSLIVTCPNCGHRSVGKASLVGKVVPCPNCHHPLTVQPPKPVDVTEGVALKIEPDDTERKAKPVEIPEGSWLPPPSEEPSGIPIPSEPTVAGSLIGNIRMVSGKEHIFYAILMYDAYTVQNAAGLRQAAQANFEGYSTGLGFWGSLPWVIGGSAVVGAFENTVTGFMAAEGNRQVQAFCHALDEMRRTAQFVKLDHIQSIRVPTPALWHASLTDGSGYTLIDDPFIVLQTSTGTTSIMWDKVEEYFVNSIK